MHGIGRAGQLFQAAPHSRLQVVAREPGAKIGTCGQRELRLGRIALDLQVIGVTVGADVGSERRAERGSQNAAGGIRPRFIRIKLPQPVQRLARFGWTRLHRVGDGPTEVEIEVVGLFSEERVEQLQRLRRLASLGKDGRQLLPVLARLAVLGAIGLQRVVACAVVSAPSLSGGQFDPHVGLVVA